MNKEVLQISYEKDSKVFPNALGLYNLPVLLVCHKKIETKLTQMAEQDRSSLMTENDVEFLRTIGIEADLETLRNGGRKSENDKMKIGII